MAIQVFHQIVESNGKTIRENNLAIPHSIPLGSLVELHSEYNDEHNGLRLFVVEHSRDCDGEPLYNLSFRKNAAEAVMKAKANFEDNRDALNSVIYAEARSAILRHIGESSLKLIR